jgi:hypothetical protein
MSRASMPTPQQLSPTSCGDEVCGLDRKLSGPFPLESMMVKPTTKKTSLPPDIQPMDATELEEIGVRLYGRWGWPVKLGRALGKDPSTLRRWRSGDSPIDLVSAAAIRDHDKRMSGAGAHSWNNATTDIDSSAIRTLRLIARVQELGSQGAAVAVVVRELETGLVVELRIGRTKVIHGGQDASGAIQGIQEMEDALDGWGK